MASVGHLAIGLAAARARSGLRHRPAWPALAFWPALSFLPDIDFVAMALGVPYGALWGHRGVTHSLGFAALVALAVAFVARARRRRVWGTAIVAALVVASHPILDAMTNHGIGCPLFWPFDSTRYALPWTPIPTVPTFASLRSVVALQVAASELLIFIPVLVFAFWPIRLGPGSVHRGPSR